MGDWSASHYENVELQLQAAADRAIEHAKVSAGERVLDVCCGSGNAAAAAAAIGAKVDGIDLADRPLALARQRVPAGHFQVADATRLPFENDAFDVAVSVFGVIFAPGELAVGELLRVVRPGGRIVITTWPEAGSILSAGSIVRRAVAQVDPPPADSPDPTPWHDRGALRDLFAPHHVKFSYEQITFRADSPQAVAHQLFDQHPLWLAARQVVGCSVYEQLRVQATQFFSDVNDDPCQWRATGAYLAAVAQVSH